MKWLITREAAAAQRDCDVLTALGVEAIAVPCITFAPRTWPTWRDRAGESVTLFTSQRAARVALESEACAGLVAATSPSTAAFLTSREVQVDITAEGGVVGLAQAVAQVWRARGEPRWHFRYPTSDAGLEREEQVAAVELLSTIGPVERAVVYETRAVTHLAETLDPLLKSGWAASFSSPSAVDAFLGARSPRAEAPAHALCFGRSTATRWNERRPGGWCNALLTHSIVETIVSLEESP